MHPYIFLPHNIITVGHCRWESQSSGSRLCEDFLCSLLLDSGEKSMFYICMMKHVEVFLCCKNILTFHLIGRQIQMWSSYDDYVCLCVRRISRQYTSSNFFCGFYKVEAITQ